MSADCQQIESTVLHENASIDSKLYSVIEAWATPSQEKKRQILNACLGDR
jgi:hypothetical protein